VKNGVDAVKDLFGVSAEVVTVLVTRRRYVDGHYVGDFSDGEQADIGGYVLAERRGRDSRANIVETLIAGTIPSGGGSAKNPRVNCSDDCVFELQVRRDFADERGLHIVGAPASADEAKGSAPAEDLELEGVLAAFHRLTAEQQAAFRARI
jgi:hypothetical protein